MSDFQVNDKVKVVKLHCECHYCRSFLGATGAVEDVSPYPGSSLYVELDSGPDRRFGKSVPFHPHELEKL